MKLAKKITTAAALAAALLAGTAPKAAAQCPYTVGPLGRYIAPAIVQGMTATDDGAACAAALAFGLHWRQWFRRGASRCRWWALYPGILPALPGSAGLHLIRAQRFPLSAFQRHGLRWRCSIRAGFCRLPEGSDSPPNGSEKQV